jgi:MFS transporter, MHS family, proline/betaine transporter
LHHSSLLLAQLGQLGFVLIVGIYGSVQPAIMVEAAPPQVRCTAVALGFNICLGVIGGLTPLAAAWLVARTGDEIVPAFLIMGAAAVSFVAILSFRETYRAPFSGAGAGAAAART